MSVKVPCDVKCPQTTFTPGNIRTGRQGSRYRSPMSQFAIFFLDWQLKSASGHFLGAYISLCEFIDNHCVPQQKSINY